MFAELEYSVRDSMALWRLIVMDLCLVVIGLASCFNGVIAFSITVTFAAMIVKIYKLDPEPFFLLSLHTIVSCLMLHDAPTTIAAIMAVSATCVTTGCTEVSFERIAVFLVSLAVTSLMGKVAAAITASVLVVAIIAIKLRPLRPAANSVLVLLLLATTILINGHVTTAISTIAVVNLTAWYLFRRITTIMVLIKRRFPEMTVFHDKTEQLYLDHAGSNIINNNNNNSINNNSQLTLANGEPLKLGNTTDSLDLHGHTVTSALKTLHLFLKEHEDSFRRNQTGHTRFLRVITGEDDKNHAEDNMNLVKPTVANFLKINKYRYQVSPQRPGIFKIDLESHVVK